MIAGITRRKPGMSIIGAVVSVGFCYTASTYALTFAVHYFDIDYSSFYCWLTFLVLAGGNFLSAFAVWKRTYLLASFSISPFVAAFFLLGGLAVRPLI